MTRRQQREEVLLLLFETEFKTDESHEEIFTLAAENREFTLEAGSYIKSTYFELLAHLEEIDAMIGRSAEGWKTTRMSRVSRNVLRIGAYELMYREDIPATVSINEAIELSKKFDDPKAKGFINGVLNKIKDTVAEESHA